MVKIGSKAPANVRTFFPRPPQTVSLCALSRFQVQEPPRFQGIEQAISRPVEGFSPPTNP
jgi:hypothetical protein